MTVTRTSEKNRTEALSNGSSPGRGQPKRLRTGGDVQGGSERGQHRTASTVQTEPRR